MCSRSLFCWKTHLCQTFSCLAVDLRWRLEVVLHYSSTFCNVRVQLTANNPTSWCILQFSSFYFPFWKTWFTNRLPKTINKKKKNINKIEQVTICHMARVQWPGFESDLLHCQKAKMRTDEKGFSRENCVRNFFPTQPFLTQFSLLKLFSSVMCRKTFRHITDKGSGKLGILHWFLSQPTIYVTQ